MDRPAHIDLVTRGDQGTREAFGFDERGFEVDGIRRPRPADDHLETSQSEVRPEP
jgi:hypothetical protein